MGEYWTVIYDGLVFPFMEDSQNMIELKSFCGSELRTY